MALEPTGPRGLAGRRPGLGAAAAFVVALVGGAAAGWFARGGGSTVTETVTAAPAPAPAAPSPAAKARAAARKTRANVRLVVLNGTTITGLAGRTAAHARTLGYRRITVGNGPRVSGRSLLYFRSGSKAAARLVQRDLRTTAPQQLPAGSPLIAQAPRGTVFVLLGPTARRLTG
jgi:hypothetical protein